MQCKDTENHQQIYTLFSNNASKVRLILFLILLRKLGAHDQSELELITKNVIYYAAETLAGKSQHLKAQIQCIVRSYIDQANDMETLELIKAYLKNKSYMSAIPATAILNSIFEMLYFMNMYNDNFKEALPRIEHFEDRFNEKDFTEYKNKQMQIGHYTKGEYKIVSAKGRIKLNSTLNALFQWATQYDQAQQAESKKHVEMAIKSNYYRFGVLIGISFIAVNLLGYYLQSLPLYQWLRAFLSDKGILLTMATIAVSVTIAGYLIIRHIIRSIPAELKEQATDVIKHEYVKAIPTKRNNLNHVLHEFFNIKLIEHKIKSSSKEIILSSSSIVVITSNNPDSLAFLSPNQGQQKQKIRSLKITTEAVSQQEPPTSVAVFETLISKKLNCDKPSGASWVELAPSKTILFFYRHNLHREIRSDLEYKEFKSVFKKGKFGGDHDTNCIKKIITRNDLYEIAIRRSKFRVYGTKLVVSDHVEIHFDRCRPHL